MAKSLLKNNIHYAWYIFFACFLIQGLSIGIVINTVGIYFIPVSNEFSCPVSLITMYVTLKGIATCVSALYVKKIIEKYPIRYVASIAVLLEAIPFILFSFSSNHYQWYIGGILQGVASCILNSFMCSYLLPKWFEKKLGMVMGISTASSGLFGVIATSLFGHIIVASSWRKAIFLQGLIMLVIMLPLSFFVLYETPEKKNIKPYGHKESLQPEKPQKINNLKNNLKFDNKLLLLILSVVFCSSLTSFGSHFAAMGTSFGFIPFSTSVLISIKLAGNTFAKVCFGSMNDKFGINKTSIMILSIVLISSLLLFVRNIAVICIAVFAFGFIGMISVTEFPLIAGNLWSKEEYLSVIQVNSITLSISHALFTSFYGLLYDIYKNYDIILKYVVLFAVIELILLSSLFRISNRNHIKS